MKAFSIAVAVTLVLAFVCFAESSALPFAGAPELEEAGTSNDTPAAAHQDVSAQSWTMPGHVREKRQSHLSLCRWCCNCCRGNKGCGFCCKF